MSPSGQKQIVLIDSQEYWRNLATRALEAAGYDVYATGSYAYPLPANVHSERPIDLIILGCASIGPAEQQVIERVLQHKHHLLVLSTALSWHVMRSLFLAGVDDAADKPYDPQHLVDTVEQVFKSIASRDSYRSLEKGVE